MAKSKPRSSGRTKGPEPADRETGATLPHPVPEVMTIDELAIYLRFSPITLYKKVQAREIPFARLGNQLRFTKSVIDRWLARHMTHPNAALYEEFARLQDRYHFQRWLEARGLAWETLTDDELAAQATEALAALREATPKQES